MKGTQEVQHHRNYFDNCVEEASETTKALELKLVLMAGGSLFPLFFGNLLARKEGRNLFHESIGKKESDLCTLRFHNTQSSQGSLANTTLVPLEDRVTSLVSSY